MLAQTKRKTILFRAFIMILIALVIFPIPAAAGEIAPTESQTPDGLPRLYLPLVIKPMTAPPPPPEVPLAPANFSGEPVGLTSLLLSWTDQATYETGYEVQAWGGSDFFTLASLPAYETEYLVEGLEPASEYLFRVRTLGLGGESDWVEGQFWTADAPVTPPIGPADCWIENLTPTSLDFVWVDSSDNEEYFYLEILQLPGDYRPLAENIAENATWVTIIDIDLVYQYAGPFSLRVSSYNSAGRSATSCATDWITPPSDATASYARFNNNASYPVAYLTIDGIQQFPAQPMGILSGSYYEVELSPGTHNYELRTGFWQDATHRFDMYTYTGEFTVVEGDTTEITIEDITIENLLTQFNTSGYWEGTYWDANLNCRTAAFVFKEDGTYNFYTSNNIQESGDYTLVDRQPDIFASRFSVGVGEDNTGLLLEPYGQFTMNNGPASWKQITYNYKPQGYQYNPFCP